MGIYGDKMETYGINSGIWMGLMVDFCGHSAIARVYGDLTNIGISTLFIAGKSIYNFANC